MVGHCRQGKSELALPGRGVAKQDSAGPTQRVLKGNECRGEAGSGRYDKVRVDRPGWTRYVGAGKE